MRVVDLNDLELEEGPGRDGFWFRAAQLGTRLDASRIGAGLYEARAGVPIWPYHYHYPTEEWLYVLQGAPVLRDPGGQRALAGGDVVCFAPGHRGAHTVEGPGRFVIFSARSQGPFVSVYPDSDKISVFPGIETDGLNALRLGRAGSVDYWYGEGHGPVEPATVRREPEHAAAPLVLNRQDAAFTRGPGWRFASLRAGLGAEALDGALLELDQGADFGPYRYDYGRELWLLVLDGAPTLRHVGGEQALSPGELVCLPDGPEGGRDLRNHNGHNALILLLWTTKFPAVLCYPETGEWVLRPGPDSDEIHLRSP